MRFTRVLKLTSATTTWTSWFESCAVYEDSQSGSRKCSPAGPFESCAVYEGTQTHPAVEKLYSYLRAVLFTRGLKPDTSGRIRIGV